MNITPVFMCFISRRFFEDVAVFAFSLNPDYSWRKTPHKLQGYCQGIPLGSFLHSLDLSDGAYDGIVDVAEMREGFLALGLPLSQTEISTLLCHLHVDKKSGELDINELKGLIRNVQSWSLSQGTSLYGRANRMHRLMQKHGRRMSMMIDDREVGRDELAKPLAEFIQRHRLRPIQLFMLIDRNEDGSLTTKEMLTGLEHLGIGNSREEREMVCQFCDPKLSGIIEFSDFLKLGLEDHGYHHQNHMADRIEGYLHKVQQAHTEMRKGKGWVHRLDEKKKQVLYTAIDEYLGNHTACWNDGFEFWEKKYGNESDDEILPRSMNHVPKT